MNCTISEFLSWILPCINVSPGSNRNHVWGGHDHDYHDHHHDRHYDHHDNY